VESSIHELDLELTASSSGHNILTLKDLSINDVKWEIILVLYVGNFRRNI
jgi:hypothetical protein